MLLPRLGVGVVKFIDLGKETRRLALFAKSYILTNKENLAPFFQVSFLSPALEQLNSLSFWVANILSIATGCSVRIDKESTPRSGGERAMKKTSGSYPGLRSFNLGWVIVVTVLLVSTPLLAQTSSTILGVVRDSSGGVVAGAAITVVNVETGQPRTATSAGDGAYRVPALQAGHYSVKIEKSGFKTVTEQNLVLDVAEEVTVNASLEVGASTQEVVVSSEAPQVNTSTSSLGGLVNEDEMADLPLNGRNYIDLTLLQSGIQQNRNFAPLGGMGGTIFSSNGAPTISNNFLLDGTPVVNQSGWVSASMGGTTLGVDGIKEYKVITNAFSAEYGITMGSQMVMVSKGGTNQFHGDAFDYLRNRALDARNYFDYGYLNGGPRLPPFQKNNFGAALGGPIKKDKTFFFAVYEGLREYLGFTVLDVVPSAACQRLTRQLDGSYRFSSAANATACASSGLSTSTVIPSFIQPLLELYPLPTNNSNNTYTFPTGGRQGVDYGQIRIDHNFSASDTLFGRYTVDRSHANAPSSNITAFIGVAFPQFRTIASSSDFFITLGENHIFSPTLLNSARVSFARTYFRTGTHNVVPLPAGTPVFVPGEQLGSLTIGGISGIGGASIIESWHLQNVYTLGDDVFYSTGKHAMKFGFLGNRYDEGLTAPTSPAGQDTYANIAGFIQGIPSVYNALSRGADPNRDFIFYTLGFYAQDDWRVTPRFTVNLGLRYEFATTPRELNGKEYAIRNYQRDATYTQGPVMLDRSYKNFSPRLGFAWDVFGKGKTSIRGAFGIYYDVANWGGAFTQNASGMPPLSSQSRVNNAGANAVVPLPFVFTPAQLGVSASVIGYNNGQPDLFQYNLTAEQQLPGNITLGLSYVGTRGAHLWTEKDGNPTIPTSIINGLEYFSSGVPTCASIVPSCRINTNWAGLQCDCTAADSWYDSLQVNLTKRLSHGLEFQSAYTYSHALNTAVGQIKGGDCTATGMDNGTDPLFPRHDFGPACFDLRHNVRFNLLYHLPNIKFTNSFLSKAVNGWWMGNIVSVQTGYPFSVVSGTLRSQSGLGLQNVTDRISVGTATVAPGAVGPDGNVNLTNKTFIPFDPNTVYTGNPQQWFNPLMFTIQPMVVCPGATLPTNGPALTCGTPGTASRGLLRGPGLGTWDFSLVKDTALPLLGEAGAIEFRAEFFNLLNRANFGMPSGTVFAGTTGTIQFAGGTQVKNAPNVGAYSQAPNATAGQITNTATTSRQIQFALKLVF